MKQEKCPKWLRMKWRKRVQAMTLATALAVTGVCPMTASAEEGVEVAAEVTVNPPVGLVLGSPSENVLTVVYGPCGMEGARYVIYLDGNVIKNDAQVAFYTFENIEPGEHKVQVTAVLEDGSESDRTKCESKITVLGAAKEESSEEVTTTEEETSEEVTTTEEETTEEETTEEETTEEETTAEEITEEETTEEESTEEAQDSEYMNFEDANTSLYCGGPNGWASAFAEVEEDGDTAVIKASNFGDSSSNEWAVQYKIDGINVTQGAEYTLSCDLLSGIDKKMVIKLDDAAGVVLETVSLKAGEVYHFEKLSAAMPQAQTQLFFAPGTTGGETPNQSGNITISNLKLTTEATAEEPEEQPEVKPEVKTGDVIAISESKESATVGDDITLTFFENEDFANAISKVLVNGESVSFDKDSDSIEIDGENFTSAGVYDIEVEADGYTTAKVYQQVFADDTWELVFADEFNGNALDTNIWTYQNGTGAEYGLNGWGNEEEQYYTSDNLSVGDGTLTIEAKKESIEGKTYTSSRIRSLADGNQGFSTTYGRIEAKIKMPAGDGIWPAFWMLPSTDDYGTWASNGEIDIMEARGRLTNEVLGTIHYGETWPNNKSAGVTYKLPDNGSITDYHTYTLEWDVGRLTWYVDGVETKTITNWYSKGSGNAENYAYPAPFDAPFHIVFNMALGGTFDGGLRPADSIFEQPVEMDVDYVRVYRNSTEGYYDREVEAPEQEGDEASFEKFAEQYADAEGNFVTDTEFTNVESAGSIISTDMTDDWSRHWYFLVGDYQGAASYSTDESDGDTYAEVNITNGGTQNYAVQMIQHLPLVKGYTYEISFDAFASKNRDMIVKLAGDDDNSWGSYSNAFTASLKSKPQHYSYTFTMDSDTDETARLEFNMGLDTGKISIANVCVKVAEATDNTNAPKEPLEDGNHVYNGTFDQGTGKLAFWNLDEAAKDAGSAVNNDKALSWKAGAVEQRGIQLLQTDKYQLTLQAAGEGETLTVSLQDKNGETVYAEKQFTLGSGMSSYELTFEMPANVTDQEAVLHMETTGSITLDNVVMKRLTDNNVSYDDVKIFPLTNGDFEDGLTGWTEYTDAGAACQTGYAVVEDGANHYMQVNGAKGSQTYFNMLIQEGVNLKKGTTYDISFKAKASSEQSLEVKIENASYTSTLAESFTVGTDWKDYKFTFKSSLEGTTALKYLLAGVNAKTTVYLDDIEIKVSGVDMKKAPALSGKGAVKQGEAVVVTYAEDTAWEASAMRVLLSDEEIADSLYTVDTAANTITIDAAAFEEANIYTIKVIAEGYDYTQVSQTIIATEISEDGNVAPKFSDWEHYVGSDWAYVSSNIVSQKDNNIELTVKASGGWADTPWGVQLTKADIPVSVGYPYTISFKAKAGQDKKFAFKAEGSNAKELFYEEYSLKAGKEQTITIKLDEMTEGFVKLYFAAGVFADETNIDTTISISDFEMVNSLETGGEEEPDVPEEPEVPETPDVTKLSGWESYYGYDWAWVTGSVVDKKDNQIALAVQAGGGWDGSQWGVQLTGNNYPVTAGEAYTISFKAKSEQDKKIAFKVGQTDDAEIFMQEYSLKAGEEQTITVDIAEMPVDTLKMVFALGLFNGETNIDTTITLSDLTVELVEEESSEAPSQSGSSSESSSSNSSSSTAAPITNVVVKVEDKLKNVIFDSKVPQSDNPEAVAARESYDMSLYGTDGILTIADLLKLKHQSMILNAFISDRIGVTIDPANMIQAMANLDLSMERNTMIDYGQGFSSVTYIPKNAAKLGYEVTIHLGIGAEHAGKVAYLFAKDMTTGELVCKQTSIINNIGNIAYTTDEYSFMVVLYQ